MPGSFLLRRRQFSVVPWRLLSLTRGGFTTAPTTAVRSSLASTTAAAAAAAAAHLGGPAVVVAAQTLSRRRASGDAAQGPVDSSPTAGEINATTSADPMSMSASPRYTSHRGAEKVAQQQENNVQHLAFSHPGSGSGHDCCGDTTCGGQAATTAPSAPRVPRRGGLDFGAVFHEEVAAWRASRHAHATPASRPIGRETGRTRGVEGTAPAGATVGPHPSSPLLPRVAEDVSPGVPGGVDLDHSSAEEEMQRFLAQNTMHSIRRSMHRENAAAVAEAVLATDSTMRTRLAPHQGHRGVQTLLDYNKQWAAEVSRFNPRYFAELAKEQKPEYLWIGCSDSRVPANEVIGLHPGDVFVHRNIGNIFSLSDLNCLSALQFAVDCLKVQHVIIAGHYKCGGVTAAMRGDHLGLTDHWIMQVADIKNKWWDRVMSDIAEEFHLNVLCELNVLEQLSHVVNCRIVQRRWAAQNAHDRYHSVGGGAHNVYVRPEYAAAHADDGMLRSPTSATGFGAEAELEVHGWVYSLDDGMLRPLLSLTRRSNVKKEIADAIEALFIRYSQMI